MFIMLSLAHSDAVLGHVSLAVRRTWSILHQASLIDTLAEASRSNLVALAQVFTSSQMITALFLFPGGGVH